MFCLTLNDKRGESSTYWKKLCCVFLIVGWDCLETFGSYASIFKKMGNVGVNRLVVWGSLSICWQTSTVFKSEDVTLHYVIIIMALCKTFCLALLFSQALESNVKYWYWKCLHVLTKVIVLCSDDIAFSPELFFPPLCVLSQPGC